MSELAHACVFVQVADEAKMDNADNIKIISRHNVDSVAPGGWSGLFTVTFSANVFSDYPAVTVNQFYNGGPGDAMNSVTKNLGGQMSTVQNQANCLYVAQEGKSYVCCVLTGYASADNTHNCWRSFALNAIGPAQQS